MPTIIENKNEKSNQTIWQEKKDLRYVCITGIVQCSLEPSSKVSSPGRYDTVSSTWTGIDSCSTVYTLAAGINNNKTWNKVRKDDQNVVIPAKYYKSRGARSERHTWKKNSTHSRRLWGSPFQLTSILPRIFFFENQISWEWLLPSTVLGKIAPIIFFL